MVLENINREELQSILINLDQALHNHHQWYDAIIRTIICNLKSDRRDVMPDAHQQCLFGQWYYEMAPPALQSHPGFNAIGDAHHNMHDMTKKILQDNNAGMKINPLDFDNFANAIQRLQLEIYSLKRELELMLYTRDPLTGAINRTDMMPILREIHEMGKRDSIPSSLIMFDIDEFKKTNDQYGHSAGDKVLSTAIHFIIGKLRPYDKLFRFGGEEFLLCMQHTDLNTCYTRCEGLRKELSTMPIDVGTRKPISITASFGVTMFDSNISVEENIENADKAMYRAKANGRNCSVM